VSTDLSFEAFDSAYHALEGFDGFLGVLARIVGIFGQVVRGCLNGAKLALYVFLGGTKDLAVVLIRNLVDELRVPNGEMRMKGGYPSKRLFKDQKAVQVESVSCHGYDERS
jgi:hypothetical protein